MGKEVCGILTKNSKETPLNGRVVNDINNQLQEENAPSLALMKKAITQKRYVVNPYFQCWQRGDVITLNSTNTPTTGLKYHADMWCSYLDRSKSDVFTFEKVPNGIKCTLSRATNLNQFIIDGFEKDKSYTLVSVINGAMHTLNFKGQQTTGNDYMKYMSRADTNSYDRIILYINNNDIVNYFDVVEENTIYPLPKEDYVIALLRCLNYLYVPSKVVSIRGASYGYMNYPYDYLVVQLTLPSLLNGATIKYQKLEAVAFVTDNIYISFKEVRSTINDNLLEFVLIKESAFPIQTDGGYTVRITGLEISKELL